MAGVAGQAPALAPQQVVGEYMQKLQAASMPVLQKMNLQDVSMLLSAVERTGTLTEEVEWPQNTHTRLVEFHSRPPTTVIIPTKCHVDSLMGMRHRQSM